MKFQKHTRQLDGLKMEHHISPETKKFIRSVALTIGATLLITTLIKKL